MLVPNPVGRHTASQLLNDPCLKQVKLNFRNRSIGSELFLSTDESSNIISQNLAHGAYFIGHIQNNFGNKITGKDIQSISAIRQN